MYFSLETCGGTGSIAFGRWKYADGRSEDEIVAFAEATIPNKAYTALLAPTLQALLDEQSKTMQDISGIVVVSGPGSFTGVRIGMSTAKALAEALAVPIVAISRLALLAATAGCEAAVLDAGRGEFYFRRGEEEQLLQPAAIRGLTGDLDPSAIAICEEALLKSFPDARLVAPPDATDALRYAVPRLMKQQYDDVVTLDGNYVRRSDNLFAKHTDVPAAEGVGA